MRKHPIILGIFLLILIGVVSFLLVLAVTFLSGEKGLVSFGEKVGVITVKGIIADSKSIVDQMNRYGDDENVKAVIVRIDSPGGGVAPSQEIHDAVLNIKKKKKVVASMGSVAASGGYYIASAADKIVANPGSVTGSIGAIMHFSNLEELFKKVGLKASVVKSGRYKDIGSPLRSMTAEERRLLQDVIDDIYEQFLEAVAANRKISKDRLRSIADGRIFTGRQALGYGLVDNLGDFDFAVELAAKISGIKGKPEVIYAKEKSFSFWKYVADEMSGAVARNLKEDLAKFKFSYLANIPG